MKNKNKRRKNMTNTKKFEEEKNVNEGKEVNEKKRIMIYEKENREDKCNEDRRKET